MGYALYYHIISLQQILIIYTNINEENILDLIYFYYSFRKGAGIIQLLHNHDDQCEKYTD